MFTWHTRELHCRKFQLLKTKKILFTDQLRDFEKNRPHMLIQDEIIRRIMQGTWTGLLKEDVI